MENRPAGEASGAQPFRVPGAAAPLEPFPGDASPVTTSPAPASAPPAPAAPTSPAPAAPIPAAPAAPAAAPAPSAPASAADSADRAQQPNIESDQDEQDSPLTARAPAMPGSDEAEDTQMLRELLPNDGPSARRVVTTLLRAILADRGTG